MFESIRRGAELRGFVNTYGAWLVGLKVSVAVNGCTDVVVEDGSGGAGS